MASPPATAFMQFFGTLSPLCSSRCTFKAVEEDEDGITTDPVAYLSNVPCIPPVGENTRQAGITFVALAGTFPYEGKFSGIDLTYRDESGTVVQLSPYLIQNDHLVEIDGRTYTVNGTNEYHMPELGFSFVLFKLKEEN